MKIVDDKKLYKTFEKFSEGCSYRIDVRRCIKFDSKPKRWCSTVNCFRIRLPLRGTGMGAIVIKEG